MNFVCVMAEGALMTKGDFTKVTFKNGIMTKAGQAQPYWFLVPARVYPVLQILAM